MLLATIATASLLGRLLAHDRSANAGRRPRGRASCLLTASTRRPANDRPAWRCAPFLGEHQLRRQRGSLLLRTRTSTIARLVVPGEGEDRDCRRQPTRAALRRTESHPLPGRVLLCSGGRTFRRCFGDQAHIALAAFVVPADYRFADPTRLTRTFAINGTRSSGTGAVPGGDRWSESLRPRRPLTLAIARLDWRRGWPAAAVAGAHTIAAGHPVTPPRPFPRDMAKRRGARAADCWRALPRPRRAIPLERGRLGRLGVI